MRNFHVVRPRAKKSLPKTYEQDNNDPVLSALR